MSTRRPKVPRSAAPQAPLTPAPEDRHGSGRARPQAHSTSTAGTGKNSARAATPSGKTAPSSGAAAGSTGKPVEPAAHPPAQLSPSEARAQQRAQLSGAIRRVSQPFQREAPAPAEETKPIPAKSFSGRLLALAVVLVTITVLLAPSVRTYLLQQEELNVLRAEIAALEDAQVESQQQLDRWEDPSYIKAQARERIFMVMPGETRYVVVGETAAGEEEVGSSGEAPQDLPWVDALWDSIERSATDS